MSDEDKTPSLDRWVAALTWYGRLRAVDERELTSELRGEWESWCADRENRRVFDSAGRFLADHDLHRAPGRPGKAELEEDSYDLSVPIAEWLSTRRSSEAARCGLSVGKWPRLLAGVAIAAVCVALIVLSPLRFWIRSSSARPAVYQTGLGGLKDVHLQDGSTVTLGAETRLFVAFSPQRRSVRLIEGQAWFTVAHNSRWPFVVAAGDGTITAAGTAFLVTRDSDRVVVTVTDGVVEVSARPPQPSSLSPGQGALAGATLVPIRVNRGEELDFRDNGALTHIKPVDTQAATAWTHGRLTFDDQPLRYVIDTLDRYSTRNIVVGPSAGALRFTGIVFDTKIDEWIQSLEVIFPVTIREQGPVVRIEIRSSLPDAHELPADGRP